MTTYLGKSCSFGLPRVPFVFEGRMWDLIVSVPDHCLSFYFASKSVKQSIDQSRYLYYSIINKCLYSLVLLLLSLLLCI